MFIELEKFLRILWVVLVSAVLGMQGSKRYESTVQKFGFALEESIESQSLVRLSAYKKLSDYGRSAYAVEVSEYSILRKSDSQEFVIEMHILRPYTQIMNGQKGKMRVIHDSNIYKPWEIFVGARSVGGILEFESQESDSCSIGISMRNMEFLPTMKAIEATITMVEEENKFESRSKTEVRDCKLKVGRLGKSILKFGVIDEK